MPVLLAAACSGKSPGPVADDPAPGSNAPSIEGVQTYPGLSHEHTTAKQSYPQTPPVGGPHWPPQAQGAVGWQQCGVDYTSPVVDEFAVHSLEHGAVWLTYQPSIKPAELATLRSLAQVNASYELLSPYPGQSSPVTATAWGLQLNVASADDPRLIQFVRAYSGGAQGGEPGADCSHGSTLAQAAAAAGRG